MPSAPVFVGVDLGDSETAVVSSAGYRDVFRTGGRGPAFDYAVALARPADRPVYGVVSVPARAGADFKRSALDTARRVFDAATVVSRPFAVACAAGRPSDALVVDIGAAGADICPFVGVYPQEERWASVDGKIDGAALANAVRGVLARFDPETRHRMRNNVVLCGGRPEWRDALENELGAGARVTHPSDAAHAGADGALALAMGRSADAWGRLQTPGARVAA